MFQFRRGKNNNNKAVVADAERVESLSDQERQRIEEIIRNPAAILSTSVEEMEKVNDYLVRERGFTILPQALEDLAAVEVDIRAVAEEREIALPSEEDLTAFFEVALGEEEILDKRGRRVGIRGMEGMQYMDSDELNAISLVLSGRYQRDMFMKKGPHYILLETKRNWIQEHREDFENSEEGKILEKWIQAVDAGRDLIQRRRDRISRKR